MKATRAQALEAIERYYFTGQPCKRGHVVKRLTISGACTACLILRDAGIRRAFAQQLREKESLA